MKALEEYKASRLKMLKGTFDIYVNKESKFLHISKKANIKVDLNFWRLIETVTK